MPAEGPLTDRLIEATADKKKEEPNSNARCVAFEKSVFFALTGGDDGVDRSLSKAPLIHKVGFRVVVL